MEVYYRHKQKPHSAPAGSWQTGMQQPFKLKDESSILSGPIYETKMFSLQEKERRR